MNIRWSIFPKFQQHLDLPGLAALIRESGLDTTNLVIRDGYWVSRSNLARDVPVFVNAMRAEGLDVRFATAGFTPEELLEDASPLQILADNGIEAFRMSYFHGDRDIPGALAAARESVEMLLPLCARHHIRCVYQVHHGTLIPHSWAAHALVQGLPSRWLGVELDPGNQTFEGFENWNRAAHLLGEYLVALGVKDSAVRHDPTATHTPSKGWSRHWCPLNEGVVNWYDVVRALKAVDFSGTFVFMPFYDQNEPTEQARKLKSEVAYLRRVVAEVEAENAGL